MPLVKYRIYELSARAVISYGRQQDGTYTFHLSAAETEKCKSLSAPHEQDDNALFYQIMCVLHGDAFTGRPGGQLVTDLSDIIFYMDFSGIFDRSGARKKYRVRQEKAKALFRSEGVSLDFGSGPHRYLAFERSGSMSRQARLSFIREDFYDAVRRRIMMDMTIGDCQLSKLYAYNGLMLSSGIRIDGIGIDRPHRVVVIDNPTRTERNVSVITVPQLLQYDADGGLHLPRALRLHGQDHPPLLHARGQRPFRYRKRHPQGCPWRGGHEGPRHPRQPRGRGEERACPVG